jgi:hypothetical protein
MQAICLDADPYSIGLASIGPFLPFGHATDFAVAADQSGRPCEAQHFPAMDGRSVPTTGIVRSEKVSLIGVEATFGQGPIFWLFEISKA